MIAAPTRHSELGSFIGKLAAKGIGARVLAELTNDSILTINQRYNDVNDEQSRGQWSWIDCELKLKERGFRLALPPN
jgi:hypothetical protein